MELLEIRCKRCGKVFHDIDRALQHERILSESNIAKVTDIPSFIKYFTEDELICFDKAVELKRKYIFSNDDDNI